MTAPKIRKQIVLDGPVSCGKSITLSLLVYWARQEGWLVLYSPKGKEWSHGGFFYKHPDTGLWDTPIQAAKILQVFQHGKQMFELIHCHEILKRTRKRRLSTLTIKEYILYGAGHSSFPLCYRRLYHTYILLMLFLCLILNFCCYPLFIFLLAPTSLLIKKNSKLEK